MKTTRKLVWASGTTLMVTVLALLLQHPADAEAGDAELKIIILDVGHNPLPPNPGNGTAKACGVVYSCFQLFPTNDAGQIFKPAKGAKYGLATLRVGPSNALVSVENSKWEMFWRVNTATYGCAGNVTSDPYRKAWKVKKSAGHKFTVYFGGTNCPPEGTVTELTIGWTKDEVIIGREPEPGEAQ